MLKSLLSPKDKKKLNEAAANELYASNLYKHIGNCLQRIGLFGCQAYFHAESADELKHYQILANFANDRLDQITVAEVPEIDDKINSLSDAFELAFETEKDLGDFYNSFIKETEDEAIKQFLLQFVEIQRNSIGEYGDFLATLGFIGDNKAAQLLFDKEINE